VRRAHHFTSRARADRAWWHGPDCRARPARVAPFAHRGGRPVSPRSPALPHPDVTGANIDVKMTIDGASRLAKAYAAALLFAPWTCAHDHGANRASSTTVSSWWDRYLTRFPGRPGRHRRCAGETGCRSAIGRRSARKQERTDVPTPGLRKASRVPGRRSASTRPPRGKGKANQTLDTPIARGQPEDVSSSRPVPARWAQPKEVRPPTKGPEVSSDHGLASW
jgi:hypothetical protein